MPSCVFCERENSVNDPKCQQCGAPLPTGASLRLDDDTFRSHLLDLVAQGEKTPAIAAYRRRTGCGLTEAVEFIEGLDSDQEFTTTGPISDVERDVGRLLERGEKINAIKVYRERTGVGLKVAKNEVEALQVRLGLASEEPDPNAGCAGMLLLLAVSAFWIASSPLAAQDDQLNAPGQHEVKSPPSEGG